MVAILKTRRSLSRVSVAALVLSVLAAPVFAHHSVPVNFDQSKEITITGMLTEIKWINPHSRFRLDVRNEDGATVEWLLEMGPINTMKRAGFDIDKFAIGDTLTIIGSPRRGRDPAMVLGNPGVEGGERPTPQHPFWGGSPH